MSTSSDQYRAADEGVAWIDRSSRVRLDVAGPDRAKFLQNLTTNDVKRLPVGSGCEAFVTSPQGKTLAFVSIHARPDSILLRTDHDGLALGLPHLQKYGIFDEVGIEDVSAGSTEYHVVGPGAAEWLQSEGATLPDGKDLSSIATQVHGLEILCVRESPTGRPGFTLISFGDVAAVGEGLRGAGLVELDSEEFEALRIEAGTPVFGREITEKTLPQEIGRDDRAISFVKGCYLGQETVARLDALGHVNKILKGLRFRAGDPVPPAGAILEAEGKAVGSVSSAAFSPGWDAAVGLGIVRVSHASPGAELSWKRLEDGATFSATVSDWPMLPRRS
ncbi:CAF17-like 4Fe-4S cluster assembly/insertion protein YgfZ [Paludisphaera mucosa]|uniref:Glycine cleavage T C-terminal barrel domain-containing protein n=1 Tax=Paludisphaera mucosa TaxID=3030827 RepID=A0ABT6F8G2_9BACT|nr:glycine cleavage T C-terminal barrel domain-containing protein [Paludisphaera mucosa]MDG3003724.1 glycine cleavage T C-terminal barrel domain-containing protein [Paludisphaera mucosa]